MGPKSRWDELKDDRDFELAIYLGTALCYALLALLWKFVFGLTVRILGRLVPPTAGPRSLELRRRNEAAILHEVGPAHI